MSHGTSIKKEDGHAISQSVVRRNGRETERVVGLEADGGEIKAQGPFYELNAEFEPQFSNEQEAAQYLVEAIRFWRDKRGFFCHDTTSKWEGKGEGAKSVDLPEEEWQFDYKTPSTCGGCVNGQKILDKIFGDRRKFNALPFVTYHGDRRYSFSFALLKHFAENGHDSYNGLGYLDSKIQEGYHGNICVLQSIIIKKHRSPSLP